MNVLLISTYELGRQPFGLASPAAWLRRAGFEVDSLDLSQCKLDETLVRRAGLICFYLPMHTATRIALRAIAKTRELNPQGYLCCYGLYAPMNAQLLRSAGVRTILGGEFEPGLVELARALASADVSQQPEIDVSLARLDFVVPDRAGLPPLDKYARLRLPDGSERVVGYTEATRGCKHLCRHCPIVPVYQGTFRVVRRAVVLEDIRRQVAAGAQHITFGDPDFFNGPAHAVELVRALHAEFPALSYDVTIKVEHLLAHAGALATLRDTGCAFVTSAVESVDDRVLKILDKGHTREDFLRVADLMAEIGLPLSPTFVPFTPWTTLAGYAELLQAIVESDLVDNVAPVQLAIRLLIPSGSRLLELLEVRAAIGEFDPQMLGYRWQNPDPRVDALQREIEALVAEKSLLGQPRSAIFAAVCDATAAAIHQRDASPRQKKNAATSASTQSPAAAAPAPARVTIPYLTEPWYC